MNLVEKKDHYILFVFNYYKKNKQNIKGNLKY